MKKKKKKEDKKNIFLTSIRQCKPQPRGHQLFDRWCISFGQARRKLASMRHILCKTG